MAFALIANIIGISPDQNGCTTTAINTSGASLLILAITNLTGTNAISDSKGNIWNGLTSKTSASNARTKIYYAENAIVGINHTFTAADEPVTVPTLMVAAFSGAKLASVFDAENGAIVAASLTVQPGSITPAEDNELLVTSYNQNISDQGTTIDSGYIITDQVKLTPGVTFGTALAYLIQTSLGASNPTWTVDAAVPANQVAVIASFKAAADSGVALPATHVGVSNFSYSKKTEVVAY